MDGLNWLVLQFFQPYFYYSLVLSLALFIAVNVAVRFTRIKDHHLRSYLFALPMLSPLLIYALYPPQMEIQIMGVAAPAFSFPPDPMTFTHIHPALPAIQNVLSVSGSLCISGIILGFSLLALCLVLNRFGTKRGFVPLTEEDHPRALSIVAKRCKRFGVEVPHIGLVEDLRPNAFVGGHGRSCVLVFSLGMLQTFNDMELTVAIDHELSHLKNRDTIFRSISVGLIALSFFNPIAYLSYSAALREREHLADDGSTPSKKSREALKSALRKSSEMTSRIEGMATVSGLRFIGFFPFFPKNMLATHPAEEKRLESINRSNRERKADTKTICLTVVCVLLLSAALLGVFVDTRAILVQGSTGDVIRLGTNGPQAIYHGSANSSQVPHGSLFDNITFKLPPMFQKQTDPSAHPLLNLSDHFVATILASN